MKRSPELMIWIVPLALTGGVAMSAAASGRGGVLAWCLATACGVSCIFAVIAGIQYARFWNSSAGSESAKQYFTNWPPEIDVLFSGASHSQKIDAVEKLTRLARNPAWNFRQEFADALEYAIHSEREDSRFSVNATRELAKLSNLKRAEDLINQGAGSSLHSTPIVHLLADVSPTRYTLRLIIRDQSETIFLKRAHQVDQEFDANEIILQLAEGARRPFEERLLYATEKAKSNRLRYPPREEVALQLMRRSAGREWLEIVSEEEFQLLAGEPWFFANQDALRAGSGKLRVNLWTLMSECPPESSDNKLQQLYGTFARQLFHSEQLR
jgi:hypothetical protein